MTSSVLSSSCETLHIFHGVFHSSSPEVFFESWRCPHLGKLFNLFSAHVYDDEGEVAYPSTYITSFPWFMRKMSSLMNRPVCCLHSHIANAHFIGFSAYQLTLCTHVNTYVILFKTHSIILIQTIFTGNCYKNGALHMNLLLIFGNASVTYSFKLRRARWGFIISGTGSSTSLRNLPIPRESLMSNLSQPSALMELHNPMREQALYQWIVHLPFIQ